MVLQPYGDNELRNKNANELVEILIGIYKRVSADEQKKSGLGLEGQEHACREYIKRKFPNAKIVEIYSDEGLSADKYTISERKQLSQMLVDAKRGKINVIVAFKQDRLARKTEEIEYICKATENFGVRIFEADGGNQVNEATPQNILTRQMLASFSQFEIELTRSRVKATKAGQKQAGKFSGGQLPYGFLWDKENQKVIEVDEEIRVWLSIIHKFLFENKGSVVIARELNEAGIPYRSGKKAYDKEKTKSWDKENVLSLLKNPTLTGRFATNVVTRFTDEDGKRRTKRNRPEDYELVETPLLREIMPLHMWKTVIEKLHDKANNKTAPRTMTTSFILSGILKCDYCSSTLQTKRDIRKRNGKSFKYSYYVCKNPNCQSPIKSYKQEDVESYVLNAIKEHFDISLINQDDFVNISNELLTQEDNEISNHIELLKSEIEEAQKGLKRIKNDYIKERLQAEDYYEMKNELEKDLKEATELMRVKSLEKETRLEKKEELVELFEAIALVNESFQEHSKEEDDDVLNSRKRALLLTFIDNVKYVNGTYKITYRKDTGSEIPQHLKRSLDKQMETVFAEVIRGQREVSASSEMWVEKVQQRPTLHPKHLQDNSLINKLMHMVSILNDRKKKMAVNSQNTYVATVLQKKNKLGA